MILIDRHLNETNGDLWSDKLVYVTTQCDIAR